MKCPTWLPLPVQHYIAALIYGDEYEPRGYRHAVETFREDGDLQSAEYFEVEIQCLNRLAGVDDDRIKDAYSLLKTVFSKDEEWRGFVAAAWAARMDYGKHRNRLRAAKKLAQKISEKTSELASLLAQCGNLYDRWPGELFSVRTLLESTDGADPLWRGMRKHILGDEQTDPNYNLRYIWGRTAPSVFDCLTVMATVAGQFEPFEDRLIGAAISKRESNPKTEYLRAFGEGLLERKIALSTPVMKAMAIAATAVIDDADIDITFKDVKQALEFSGITGRTTIEPS